MNQDFSGNIFIFHSFDVGDIIDLEMVKSNHLVDKRPLHLANYFKQYHTPLEVELPHPHATSHCESAKLHSFGVITLRYKVPFNSTLEKLRSEIEKIENEYREQSVEDAAVLFKQIKKAIKKPNFFHIARSYLLIQVNVEESISGKQMEEQYGSMIASILRFETAVLSDYKRNEILEKAFGYYRGDLIIIDTEAAFIYDKDYEEVLDLLEFVNLQQLELQYFDRILDEQLNKAYELEVQSLPIKAYLPLWGTINLNRVSDLGNLRVEISVITERLENSIKLTGEPYYAELYEELKKTLDLAAWKESIDRKLDIIHDISSVYEAKISTVREDMFNVLITVLIFMELVLGVVHYLKV